MISAARQTEILSAQSVTARKVFDVVPMQDWWTPHKIIAQLGNTVGRHEVVLGTLDTLRRSGLVREKGGAFQREPVRAAQDKKGLADLRVVLKEAETPPETKDPMPAAKPSTPQHIEPVEHISALSQRLHALALRHTQERAEQAERHEQELRDLANEVADAAVEVQASAEAATEEVQAARGLKALLSKIGG